MLRRRRLPGELEAPFQAFRELVTEVERAKAGLTACVPSTRLPGRPLADALLEYEEALRRVRAGMGAWRAAAVEDEWRAAADGLERALAMADHVRTRAPAPGGFEGLIAMVGDLLEPLEPFAAAAERFRDLRRRPSGGTSDPTA